VWDSARQRVDGALTGRSTFRILFGALGALSGKPFDGEFHLSSTMTTAKYPRTSAPSVTEDDSGEEPGRRNVAGTTGSVPAVPIDRIDLKILSVLQQDARITKRDLADKVGLSASACIERMNRLEKAHVIRGYHAELELPRLVATMTVFAEIVLKRHHADDFQQFESTMRRLPEVVECCALGGGIDYLVKFVTRDIVHYQELIEQLLDSAVGIDRYFTYVVTKQIKRAAEYPIAHLLARR
jgi:Lrp/AsnC family transcriptional regulator of ectoine degradation